MKDGRKLEKYIDNVIGSVKNPMSDAALEAKFADLAQGVIPAAQARKVMDLCWGVEKLAERGGRGQSRGRMTRRTLLAAMGAVPAFAQQAKGPKVFLDYDQAELDAAYNQASYAPNMQQLQARARSNSDRIRARLGQPMRSAYGPTEIERLDIYRAKGREVTRPGFHPRWRMARAFGKILRVSRGNVYHAQVRITSRPILLRCRMRAAV